MQIKRFTAGTVREAMQQMRTQLGSEAVILSNHSLGGQVEVVGAIDYDEDLLREAVPARRRSATAAQNSVDQAAVAPGRTPMATANARPMDNLLALGIASAPTPDRVGGAGHGDGTEDTGRFGQDGAAMLSGIDRTVADLAHLLHDHVLGALWQGAVEQQPNQRLAARWFTRLGFDPKVAGRLVHQIPAQYDATQGLKFSLGLLAKRFGRAGPLPHETGGVVALCGPPGSGKTAAGVKIASAAAARFGGHRVAFLSLDNRSIGGHEQLLTYGQLLGIHVRAVDGPEQLPEMLNQLAEKALVIVEGAAHWSDNEARQLQRRTLSALESVGVQVLLTLPGYGESSYLRSAIERYATPDSNGCVVTHFDAAVSPGVVLSSVLDQELTPCYATSGPGDCAEIEPFDGNALIRRLVRLVDNRRAGSGVPEVPEVTAHGAG